MATYYEILGVSRSAKKNEIKTAYHILIKKYHPDHNPDPTAAAVTAKLNEAYSTLADDQKRSVYDAFLRATAERSSASERTRKPAEAIPDIVCEKCRRMDATIRLSLMYYTVSLLFTTHRRGASGLWCERCRSLQAAKWSTVSALAGWWGIPWGPIYTLHALFVNASGGKQPKENNAFLLRTLGYQLYARGELIQAAEALRRSVALQPDAQATQLLEYLCPQQITNVSEWNRWSVLGATPLVVTLLGGILGFGYVAGRPSGYEASYQPPVAMTHDSTPRALNDTNLSSSGKSQVSGLMETLASIVDRRAPIVGSHMEGTTQIEDHVLDRSKFDSSEIYAIAASVRSKLESGTPDPDGFLASAYFNSELLALSIDIVNGMNAGAPIRNRVLAVERLGNDPYVVDWLSRSRYFRSYQALVTKLQRYDGQYRPGSNGEDLEASYESDKGRLRDFDKRLQYFQSINDVDSYNSLIPEYNALVHRSNVELNSLRVQVVGAQKLDIAFNKCLDTAIFMTKFQRIDLTSGEAKADQLPEPNL